MRGIRGLLSRVRTVCRVCRHCGQTVSTLITWLPPVLSVSGRCRYCRTRLGPAACSIEITTTIGLGLLAWRTQWPFPFLAFAWVAIIGVAAYIDIAVHRLPNQLVGMALSGNPTLLALTALLDADLSRLVIAALGAPAVAAFYLLLGLLPHSYGLGDVKPGFVVGLTTGWYGVPGSMLATFIAVLLAGLTGITLALRQSSPTHIPHGPFMLVGAVTAILLVSS